MEKHTLSMFRTQYEMSDAARIVLAEEERNGARIQVYYRFFFLALFFFASIGIGGATDLFSNFLFSSIILVFNVLLVFKLKSGRRGRVFTLERLSLVAILFDFALFLGMALYYYIRSGESNFAFVMKNPILTLMTLPILTTALQFRMRLIFFALGAFIAIFIGLAAYGVYREVPRTEEWTEYILGNSVILPAFLLVLPALGTGFASIIAYTVFRSRRMLNRIGTIESQKNALSRYFSPDVIEEITTNPHSIEMGKRQRVTILFSDIRNFTALSERISSDELADLLRNLRRLQIESVFECGGTIDKFIGDAIMATFGTPRPAPEAGLDSRNAVRCGTLMLKRLQAFNQARLQRDLAAIEVGIGIHCGEVFAGNIGDEMHMEYTVIGDAVNTASRIESLCKKLARNFLISEDVCGEINGFVTTEKMPLVRVKGKEIPLQVYAIGSP
ncbi:MAG: adenylate/guanylate cyclase domain-containing protein [Leptospirales bacterium]|nr:adenylate/guanylate cyclase domain-containing protein [Leptospirales bacterium]